MLHIDVHAGASQLQALLNPGNRVTFSCFSCCSLGEECTFILSPCACCLTSAPRTLYITSGFMRRCLSLQWATHSVVCAQSVTADFYAEEDRGKAFGTLHLTSAAGAALGGLYATNLGGHCAVCPGLAMLTAAGNHQSLSTGTTAVFQSCVLRGWGRAPNHAEEMLIVTSACMVPSLKYTHSSILQLLLLSTERTMSAISHAGMRLCAAHCRQ